MVGLKKFIEAHAKLMMPKYERPEEHALNPLFAFANQMTCIPDGQFGIFVLRDDFTVVTGMKNSDDVKALGLGLEQKIDAGDLPWISRTDRYAHPSLTFDSEPEQDPHKVYFAGWFGKRAGAECIEISTFSGRFDHEYFSCNKLIQTALELYAAIHFVGLSCDVKIIHFAEGETPGVDVFDRRQSVLVGAYLSNNQSILEASTYQSVLSSGFIEKAASAEEAGQDMAQFLLSAYFSKLLLELHHQNKSREDSFFYDNAMYLQENIGTDGFTSALEKAHAILQRRDLSDLLLLHGSSALSSSAVLPFFGLRPSVEEMATGLIGWYIP